MNGKLKSHFSSLPYVVDYKRRNSLQNASKMRQKRLERVKLWQTNSVPLAQAYLYLFKVFQILFALGMWIRDNVTIRCAWNGTECEFDPVRSLKLSKKIPMQWELPSIWSIILNGGQIKMITPRTWLGHQLWLASVSGTSEMPIELGPRFDTLRLVVWCCQSKHCIARTQLSGESSWSN